MACSSFWKLDKIDKIVISLIFILSALFSCCSCFCFASETLEPSQTGLGLFIDSSGNIISDDDGRYIVYNFDKPGNYTFSTKIDVIVGFVNNNPSVGDKVIDREYYKPGEFFTIYIEEPSEYSFFVVTSHNVSAFYLVDVQYEPVVGFSSVIDKLSLNVGISQIWEVFETPISLVVPFVLVAFGYFIIARVICSISKGKGRI